VRSAASEGVVVLNSFELDWNSYENRHEMTTCAAPCASPHTLDPPELSCCSKRRRTRHRRPPALSPWSWAFCLSPRLCGFVVPSRFEWWRDLLCVRADFVPSFSMDGRSARRNRVGCTPVVVSLGLICLSLLLTVVWGDTSVAWTFAFNSTGIPLGHTSTYIPARDSVIVIGGTTTTAAAVSLINLNQEVYELDVSSPDSPTWSTLSGATVPSAWRSTGSVSFLDPSHSQQVFVWGGFTGGAYINDLRRVTLTTGAWTSVTQDGATPSGRAFASLTRVCIPDEVQESPSLTPFSINSDPTDACGASAAPVYVLFGGQTSASESSDTLAVMRGNETGHWMSGAIASNSGPSARYSHSAVSVTASHPPIVGLQCLLVFGGVSGSTVHDDLWQLCPDAIPFGGLWTWTQRTPAGDAPVQRYGAAAATIASNRFFLQGGHNNDFPNDYLQVRGPCRVCVVLVFRFVGVQFVQFVQFARAERSVVASWLVFFCVLGVVVLGFLFCFCFVCQLCADNCGRRRAVAGCGCVRLRNQHLGDAYSVR